MEASTAIRSAAAGRAERRTTNIASYCHTPPYLLKALVANPTRHIGYNNSYAVITYVLHHIAT